MRTVYDFIKRRCCLSVTCRNCDHQAFIGSPFLQERLGIYGIVAKATCKCSVCQCVNIKSTPASADLAVESIDPKMHFAGVYEKYLFDR